VSCGATFHVQVVIDGRRLKLYGRRRCLQCRPHRPLGKPRKRVARPPKSLVCVACGRKFPAKMVIDGKLRSLYRRTFCLQCSPFRGHNTSRTPFARSEDVERARRDRRREQFRRSLRQRRRNRKRELVEAYGGKCIECGYSACLEALQFHHRDAATKRFSLANFNGSYERLRAEAEKCDLLCANCHRLRHTPADADLTTAVALRRKKKTLAIERFDGVCLGCRKRYPATLFEFHHWDSREKEFEIATGGMGRSWQTIVDELIKCVMLCVNCHSEIHAGQLILDREHDRVALAAS
jgi:hypothetical protein